MAPTVHTSPVGQPGGMLPSWSVVAGRGWAAAGWEDNPDLMFPWSVHVYDRMRRTDTQIGSLLRAVTLPIRSATWDLVDTGVDPAIAAFVADELNLNAGMHQPGGLNWPDHLREALLALAWGFAPFETVYEVGPARTPGAPPQVAHLKGLYPRPPRTLVELRVTPEGDLDGIVQVAPGMDPVLYAGYMASPSNDYSRTQPLGGGDIWIPRSRLAYYCMDREGADWAGTSLLRGAYKDWFLKEQALRYAGQGVERNSMGLPVVGYDQDSDRAMALDIATAARAGSTAGIAIPRDRMDFALVGVTGQTVDPMPLIRYHDQAMTRAALAMFLDLGHDNGARSLGDTFVDFFTLSLRSVSDWIAVTATKEIIRPLVDVNFGPGHPIPMLRCEQITAGHPATSTALKDLVDAGIVTPDAGLEGYVRRAHGLPQSEPASGLPAVPRTRPPVDEPDARPMAAAMTRAEELVERLALLAADSPKDR